MRTDLVKWWKQEADLDGGMTMKEGRTEKERGLSQHAKKIERPLYRA